MFTPADYKAILDTRGQWKAFLRTGGLAELTTRFPANGPTAPHLLGSNQNDPMQTVQALKHATLQDYYAIPPGEHPALPGDYRLPWFEYLVAEKIVTLPDFQIVPPTPGPSQLHS